VLLIMITMLHGVLALAKTKGWVECKKWTDLAGLLSRMLDFEENGTRIFQSWLGDIVCVPYVPHINKINYLSVQTTLRPYLKSRRAPTGLALVPEMDLPRQLG
jgi:hypothetical protein